MISRVDHLKLHTVRVPLLRPFVTAVRRADWIDAVLVEVVDSDGRHGWGEAPASWRVTGESSASIRAAVTGPLADAVVGRDAAEVPILSAELALSVVNKSAARSAEALRLIAAAAANEIGIVVGCMMGSHVGIAAAAAIAGTLAPADGARAQDLDAGLWLRSSPVVGGALIATTSSFLRRHRGWASPAWPAASIQDEPVGVSRPFTTGGGRW